MSRAKPQKKTAKTSSSSKTENAQAAAIAAATGPPVVSSCQPQTLPHGIETIVTLTGQNLPGALGGYAITNTEGQGVAGFGLRFANQLPTPTKVTLGITVASDVAPDTYDLLVRGALGSTNVPLNVTSQKPPRMSSLSPNVIDVYSSLVLVEVTVSGDFLPMSVRHYYVNAAGVGLSLDIVPTPTSVRVLFALDPTRVHTGDYQLSAFNSAGAYAMTIHINKH
jgi:hypothetical protein